MTLLPKRPRCINPRHVESSLIVSKTHWLPYKLLPSIGSLGLALISISLLSSQAGAQASDSQIQTLRLEGTPIGALPPMPLAMPASRNNNYWGARLQSGRRQGGDGAALDAIAAGIDFQYRGGSVFGLTAGYQKRDCDVLGPDCGGHAMYGVRSRLNLITGGGLSIPLIFGEGGATTTIGADLGFGYAPEVAPGITACTMDFGVQFSLAGLQRTRLITYVTPGVMWDTKCSSQDPAATTSYFTGFGIGLQQVRSRSVDVYVGLQKIFRDDSGYRLGVSIIYLRLP